ncbi:efflux RND transporter periplasmic adaptor subunit [Pseudogracilibacillus sp. SE30717A]|uniref:efflux RND transporter periplasmic adaptor subunit n=1 Tax=Pseudogracilibacillus sp. SE30717A TaxID=3098293 RepID=UPI00300E40ED
MKKKWIVIGVITVIVLFIGINVWKNLSSSTIKVETATLKEEVMKETVITPGTLKLDKEQYVYLQPEKGEVAEIYVEEGEQVKKNDKLIRYENKQLDLEKQQNELQIRSTALNLENIRKQHQDIDKELEKDKENDMLQQEHDQIKLDQQMTNIELEQANLQKESISSQIEDLIVKSDVDGTVLSVNEETSTQSQMSEQSIIRIGSLDDVVVEGTISEYDTLNISEDQEVILTSDAVPDEEWTGKVSFIGDLPEEKGLGMEQSDSSVLYPIRVTLDEDIKLKPGFKMLIEIVTSEAKVQTLPINAVQQGDDKNYVYVVKGGKATRAEVKIGSVDSEKIEIKDGITKDDKVIVNPSDSITEGMEVTIK